MGQTKKDRQREALHLIFSEIEELRREKPDGYGLNFLAGTFLIGSFWRE